MLCCYHYFCCYERIAKWTPSVVVSAEVLKTVSAISSIFHWEVLSTKAECVVEAAQNWFSNDELMIRR